MTESVVRAVLRILLCLLLIIAIIVVCYVAYVFLAYNRLPDRVDLTPDGAGTVAYTAGGTLTVMSFNIGFGAYEPDFGFFMDGGTESWATSEEALRANIAAIGDYLSAARADVLFLQEVDEDGTRTYHFDERQALTAALPGYSTVWAQNWDSPFLFYPLTQPHGKNRAGIMTFSRLPVTSAVRRSLPVENSVMRVVDLDRCYSVSRVPVAEGRELVLYNVHLSAYTSDGSIALEQIRMLVEDMDAEARAGNYVICGGDFNRDLPGNSDELFGNTPGEYTWAQPFPTDALDGTQLRLIVPLNTENPVPSCRNADGPYTPQQYVVTVDGFIVSSNVRVQRAEVCDTAFAYSDHNPVRIEVVLE